MIFDTGASVSTFGKNQLRQANLASPLGQPTKSLTTQTGDTVPAWDMSAKIALGEIKRQTPIAVVEHLDKPLLGQTFFSDLAYDVDTASGVIRFSSKKGSNESKVNRGLDLIPQDAVAVPFTREGKELVVEAKVNGNPYLMYFDTGASSTVFSVADLESLGISVSEDAPAIVARGIAGETQGYLVKLSRLEFGPVLKSNFSVAVLSQSTGRALLGQNFLAGKRFTIDNDKNVIYFWH